MRAFRAMPRALPMASRSSSMSSQRALYATWRASTTALRPLESREGRVENAGINDPALRPFKDAVSKKAGQAKEVLKEAAHSTGADEALRRAEHMTGGMGEKVKEAANAAEEKMAPEVRKYPVEFSMATGAGAVGVGLMLWWFYMYLRPQTDVQNEMARRGGPGIEEAKKIVEAQKPAKKVAAVGK